MDVKIYVEKGIEPGEARTGWISQNDDHTKRHSSIRSCVDGFLEYELNGKKGILMAYRDGIPPQSGKIWVPGGEWPRGIMGPAEALAIKIKKETNLEITDAEYLGMISILWKESPYDSANLKTDRNERNLGEGIHDIGHVFFARATGDLKLKTMNPPIIIVTPENYEEVMNSHNVHDYIRYFAKEALKRIS